MNLARHNYEEFFILYLDNELSPAERRQVEAFVVLHPDLKEELDLLMQFKLQPDESIVFDAKDELLKDITLPVVNSSNYKAWLMLYLDNELNSTDRKLVEQFLATHPAAQTDWRLLEKTKLQAEPVIFADKASLYRKENVRRMPVRWFKVAAAAVLLLGIGISTAILVAKKPGSDKELVKTTTPVRKMDSVPIIPEPRQEVVADNSTKKIIPEEQKIASNNTPPNTVVYKTPELVIPQNKKDESVAVINEELPTNNLPKPLQNSFMESKVTNKDVAVNPASVIRLKEDLTITPVTKQSGDPSIIYARNPETDDAELDQTDGKKTKLRGLFRKVARTFEKRTNIAAADDENKLLVAGLAFKLK